MHREYVETQSTINLIQGEQANPISSWRASRELMLGSYSERVASNAFLGFKRQTRRQNFRLHSCTENLVESKIFPPLFKTVMNSCCVEFWIYQHLHCHSAFSSQDLTVLSPWFFKGQTEESAIIICLILSHCLNHYEILLILWFSSSGAKWNP